MPQDETAQDRPLIGVTSVFPGGAHRYALTRLALGLAGGRALRLSPDGPVPERLDGLIIGGGDDIGAEHYTGEPDSGIDSNPARDELELALLDRAGRRDMPVLGICRGMQMMNVARGGTLHKDLSRRFPRARRTSTILPLKTVAVDADSRLGDIVGAEACRINGLHSQAVKALGQGLEAVARDPVGIVEALEDRDRRFFVGVQWHPEFLLYSGRHRRLFEALVGAARAFRADAGGAAGGARSRRRHGSGELPPDRAVWQATAIEAPATAALTGRERADVAVVGGGVTGLSAALHLAEAGRSVVLLDARAPAGGASGLAAGQIVPGLHDDPDDLVQKFGERRGERLVAWAGGIAAGVFALIERHRIDCQPATTGWIEAAYTGRELAQTRAAWRQWVARGADVRWLDRDELAARLGTPAYLGGWLDTRGGSVQPLNYTLGLAHAARRCGVRLFAPARALRLDRREGRWRVSTASGEVDAGHVVVAPTGYTGDVVPGLGRSVVPVLASQAASAPLGRDMLEAILPGREVAADRRRMLVSFRITPDDRLVIGGPGGTGEAKGPALFRHVEATRRELFGHLPPVAWEFGWSGWIALTRDKLPHLHEPEEGLHVVLGYNGRGLALATALGRMVAERVCGRPAGDLELPPTAMKPIPLHGLAGPVIAAGQRVRSLMDRFDRRFR